MTFHPKSHWCVGNVDIPRLMIADMTRVEKRRIRMRKKSNGSTLPRCCSLMSFDSEGSLSFRSRTMMLCELRALRTRMGLAIQCQNTSWSKVRPREKNGCVVRYPYVGSKRSSIHGLCERSNGRRESPREKVKSSRVQKDVKAP